MSARHCEALATKLEQRAAAVLASSLVGRVARVLTGQNNRAQHAIVPATFLYSFEHAGHWMSVTFLPSSETSTLVRYDLFRSSSTACDGDTLSQVVENEVRTMIKELETEFSAFSEQPGYDNRAFDWSYEIDRLCEYRSSTPDTDWSKKGTLHQILDQIQEHAKLEKTHGVQVLPAMRQPKGSSQFERAEQRELLPSWVFSREISN